MKKLFLPVFFLVLCISATAQQKPFAIPPDNAPTANPNLNKEEAQVLFDILQAKIMLQACALGVQSANCKESKPEEKMADALAKAVKMPRVINSLLAGVISDYESSRESTKSAMQVSQLADEHNVVLNRIIVAQNQRIIQLLEQLVNKR